jgi:hypothetical protein
MKPWKRRFLTLFILFTWVGILVGKPWKDTPIGRFYYPYLIWTRQLQQWKLFTPSPRVNAFKYRVEINYRDGTRTTWMRPYPPQWDFFERQKCYHFQKWDLATNRLDSTDSLWPGLVAYMKSLYDNASNPIETIELIRMTAERQPPHEEGYVMHDDSELRWSSIIIFKYDAKTGAYERGLPP